METFHFSEPNQIHVAGAGLARELLDAQMFVEDESHLELSPKSRKLLKQDGWRVHKLLNAYMRFFAQSYFRDLRARCKLSCRGIQPAGARRFDVPGRFNAPSFSKPSKNDGSVQNLARGRERWAFRPVNTTACSDGMVCLDAVHYIQADL